MKRIAIAAGAGLFAAWVVAQLLRPWNFLPGDQPVVLVSENCPISNDVVASAAAFEEVRDQLVIVPIDPDRSEARETSCELALEAVHEEAPWFSLLPDPWVCEQLVRDAAPYHRDNFTSVPVYTYAGEQLSGSRLDLKLQSYELSRKRGLIVPTARLAELEEPPSEREPSRAEGGVRGRDMGF